MNVSANAIERYVLPYIVDEIAILQPISTLSAMFVVYGIYVVVFGLSVHILSSRGGSSSKLYMGWTITLFVFATFYTFGEVWGALRQTLIIYKAVRTRDYETLYRYITGVDPQKTVWLSTSIVSGFFMSVIADIMLIHRCYIVWQSKIMMFLLAFIAIVLNAITLGCILAAVVGSSTGNAGLVLTASTIDNTKSIAISVFQALLALLTGGRIWWITRKARLLMGRSTDARYNSIVAIIVESGVLYASFLIIFFIYESAIDPHGIGLVPYDFGPVITLMSGLAPTLIIVRVAHGKSVDSVQQVVSTLHFADGQGNNQRSRPVVDLHVRTQVQLRSEWDDLSPLPAASEKMV